MLNERELKILELFEGQLKCFPELSGKRAFYRRVRFYTHRLVPSNGRYEWKRNFDDETLEAMNVLVEKGYLQKFEGRGGLFYSMRKQTFDFLFINGKEEK